ncbi:citrate synthase [Diplodia corticola]|uniref:Citrate synthase n=1 Tax=Diplodia corticola TaxID=236234 RepID=A0A1J9QW11_9PEZI|nr:citrate synthase [Diplodia corticola]OJD32186.1 citrate synthase [Diplodia corticola]
MIQQHPTTSLNGLASGLVPLKAADGSNSLTVVDNRTGQTYTVPIWHNSVNAAEFKQIKTPEDPDNLADQNNQGLRIFDPGYGNTTVAESTITFIDGLKGMIQYRGYDIKDIVKSDKRVIDVCHLLWRGAWPTKEQAQKFQQELNNVPVINDTVLGAIRAIPKDGSPVGMIISGLMALQSQDMDLVPAHAAATIYHNDPALVDTQLVRIFSSLVQITAAAYCHATSRAFTPPRADFSTIENFFLMTGHIEAHTGLPNPRYVRYFETLWTLLADHEMTCSTAAMLQTASAMPDAISALVSAISAFYGPLHGGAIEVAYRHIRELGGVENIPAKMARVHAREERLYGYGHRVYRVPDPRYKPIQDILFELKSEVDADPLLKVALELDRVARHDDYFIKRKLNPNADLYATLAYNAMGFAPDWILPITIIARSQGLLAHFKEAMLQPQRIWRPGQVYTGPLNKKLDE